MNDYKELVKALRCCGDASPFNHCDECPYEYQGKECFHIETAAADAIEQLVKERDAAVDDLKEGSFCMNCKHLVSTKEEKPCRHCSSLTGGGEDNWEWRGVQEDNR